MLKVDSLATKASCTAKRRLATVPIFGKRSWRPFYHCKGDAPFSALATALINLIISSSSTKLQLSSFKSSSINDNCFGSGGAAVTRDILQGSKETKC